MERDFKGVWIPKEIWINKELTWMEKLFFVEIDSLDNENGCFASNDYFSDFFYLTRARCSQVINSLIKKEYIKATYEREGKEIKKRVLNIFNRGIKYSKLGSKYIKEGYLGKFTDNNTDINNTVNNTKDLPVKKDTGLFNDIHAFFKEKNPSYYKDGKQATAITKLITRCKTGEVIFPLLEKFIKIKAEAQKGYWLSVPITPAAALASWDSIISYQEKKPFVPYRLPEDEGK